MEIGVSSETMKIWKEALVRENEDMRRVVRAEKMRI
jgi:hypothetical protein